MEEGETGTESNPRGEGRVGDVSVMLPVEVSTRWKEGKSADGQVGDVFRR